MVDNKIQKDDSISNQQYLVAEKWRGAINVDSMRILNEKQAATRAKQLKDPNHVWALKYGWHIWKVHPSKPAQHVKRADLEYLYSIK